MKKAILILALMMPLSAQSTETDIEVSKDERQRFEDTRYHKTEPIAARKYREYRNRRQEVNATCVCKKVLKKNRIKSVVRIAVIGGVAYYVGYSEGQKRSNPMRRRFPMDRK